MYITSRIQFPPWILQVSTTHGDSRCGSESEDHARHPHIQKRQDIPGNQVQSLEHKALSIPLPHPEDENILGIGRETWTQVLSPATNPSQNKSICNKINHNQPNQAPSPESGNPQDPKQMSLTKEEKTMIVKRRYKVRVLIQPTPSTPTATAPTPMVATVSTQTLIVKSTAESIPVMVYKLAMGQFAEIPHQTPRSLNDNTNPPPLEYIPGCPS